MTASICIPIADIPACLVWRAPGVIRPYPSRAQMVDYLESYAARFGIRAALDATVSRISRDGAQWRAETTREQRPRRP